HPVVGPVGDDQVAGGIQRDPAGVVEGSGDGRSAIARVTGDPGASHGGDDAAGDTPNALAREVRDVEGAGGVERDGARRVEAGAPVPANVVMMPDVLNLRIRLLYESAM